MTIMFPSDSDTSDTFGMAGEPCSLDHALEIVGDRWSMRILREAFHGVERFEEFRNKLKVASNILSDRLRRLVESGLLERQLYCLTPARYAYRLTPRGRDFKLVFRSMVAWTNRHWDERGGLDWEAPATQPAMEPSP